MSADFYASGASHIKSRAEDLTDTGRSDSGAHDYSEHFEELFEHLDRWVFDDDGNRLASDGWRFLCSQDSSTQFNVKVYEVDNESEYCEYVDLVFYTTRVDRNSVFFNLRVTGAVDDSFVDALAEFAEEFDRIQPKGSGGADTYETSVIVTVQGEVYTVKAQSMFDGRNWIFSYVRKGYSNQPRYSKYRDPYQLGLEFTPAEVESTEGVDEFSSALEKMSTAFDETYVKTGALCHKTVESA